MASNRVIDADNDVVIKGITWPSSDGSADQVLKTDGNGTLSFADAGGGADVDTIANASDAANYTGTAKFINITSSVDVTFTSDLSDRIINIANNITVNFTVDSLKNCIIKGETAEVIIESPYQPDTDTIGTHTNIYNCDIRVYTVRVLAGAYELNPGGGTGSHNGLNVRFYNSTIYSRYNPTSDPTFGLNFSTITNFSFWEGAEPSVYFYNSLFSNAFGGNVLAEINVYFSEARIQRGATANPGVAGVTGRFNASGTGSLIIVRVTDSSFVNSLNMSTNTFTVQHKFA